MAADNIDPINLESMPRRIAKQAAPAIVPPKLLSDEHQAVRSVACRGRLNIHS
jgi:hypothetical protein